MEHPLSNTPTYLTRYRGAVIQEMQRVLGDQSLAHYTMMRYHLGWATPDGSPTEASSGKMLRPTLCLLACEAVGGDWRSAVPAAAAIEILHNFSLVHDDIEDRSHERHGRPTVWDIWGEAQAINVGDGMFVLAHQALLGLAESGVDSPRLLNTMIAFDQAARRLCEGQYRDMSFERRLDVTVDDYFAMISGKTAALIEASCGVGAYLGGAGKQQQEHLETYGRELGIAFQVYDDYLGIWGESEKTGKSTFDDIRDRKKSFPIVFALERASEEDAECIRSAFSRETVDDESVAQVAAVLDRVDAAQATIAMARVKAAGALTALDVEGIDRERREELRSIVAFVIDRSM